VVAHRCWGIVGTAGAAQQRGFCRVMFLGHQCWRIGEAMVLSRCWHRCAGVQGEGADNQLEGREEGGRKRATCSMTSSTLRGMWHFGGRGGASGGVVGGWAAVQRTMCLQAAAFGGMLRCAGRCCRGRGGRARHCGGGRGERVVQRTTRGSWAAAWKIKSVP
jgi:hypothetical protein